MICTTDGSVTFSTKLDNSELEKQLEEAKHQIEELESELSSSKKQETAAVKEQERLYKRLTTEKEKYLSFETKYDTLADEQAPLIAQLEEVQSKMAQTQTEIEEYKKAWLSGEIGADSKEMTARDQLRTLQTEYEALLVEIGKMDPKIQRANQSLKQQRSVLDGVEAEWHSAEQRAQELATANSATAERIAKAKAEAAGLSDRLADAKVKSEQMDKAMSGVEKRLNKLNRRFFELIKSALLFSLITSGLNAFRDWMGQMIRMNGEASASIAQLKGALLTLSQPILDVVVPAFITLVNILTRVISAVAQLISFLFGKSFGQSKKAAKSLNAEAKAIKGVGSAAEEAAGSLAGFDEINTITTENTGGGSGGAGGGSGIEPDFDFESALLGEDQLRNLLGLIEAIGSALLAWKIGSSLGLGMKEILGLALGIFETIQFVKNMFDAWTNGVNWDNLLGMLAASAGMAAGFGLAFGKIGAGISLIISGLAMLATGFHDALENGWTLENTLLSIAGILEAGMGISILTGSWIPLLISGIAAALLALTVATGHGEELLDGIRNVLDGLKNFITGVFTGDIEKALEGIGQMFEGLSQIVDAVFDALCDTVGGFFDWLDEKTNGQFHGILMTAKGFVLAWLDGVRSQLQVTIEAAKQILQGIITFLSGVFTNDWDKAWEGVKMIFKGIWNGIVGLFENAVNFIIKGLNWLIQRMNKIRFTVPDWVPGVGGKSYGINIPSISNVTIPRLATGAVVPPNREFLAMLGDNKTETEVVSPLSTMKQAFLEALQESSGTSGGTIQVVLMLDGKELARNQVKHINNMTRAAGKPVILV